MNACYASIKAYCYRRIGIWLLQKRAGVINHKATLRLMNQIGIHSYARQSKPYPKLNQLLSDHFFDNVLRRDFSTSHPNHNWVADVTYIPTY